MGFEEDTVRDSLAQQAATDEESRLRQVRKEQDTQKAIYTEKSRALRAVVDWMRLNGMGEWESNASVVSHQRSLAPVEKRSSHRSVLTVVEWMVGGHTYRARYQELVPFNLRGKYYPSLVVFVVTKNSLLEECEVRVHNRHQIGLVLEQERRDTTQ